MIEYQEKLTQLAPFEKSIGISHKLEDPHGYSPSNIGPLYVFLLVDTASELKGMHG
jgi:hypothetical protein